MKRRMFQVSGVVAGVVAAFSLAIVPGAAQAGEVGIPERPDLPGECEVVILPVPGPDHCGKPPIDNPPVSILPIPYDPPVSTLPVDRFGDLRLWIVRKGEGQRWVSIHCGPRCAIGQSLLRASRPLPTRNCRAVPGNVRAGGFWQGRMIGPFHNRTTCRASQWAKVAPIYNRMFP